MPPPNTNLGMELNTKIQVRRAKRSEAEQIAAVLAESFAEFAGLYAPEGFAATTPDAEQVRRRMEEGPIWVAELDEHVVGTVAAVLEEEDGLYIRGMAVVPSARDHRVGENLLNAVQRFAAESGCRRLFLSTTPFLTAAIRLYERFGFERSEDGPHDLFGTPLFTMSKELKSRSEVPGVRNAVAFEA